MAQHRRIMVLLDPNFGYSRAVLRGISAHFWPDRGWITLVPTNATYLGRIVRQLQIEGVAGFLWPTPQLTRLLARGMPAVGVSNSQPLAGVPRVGSDDAAVGRLAAEYFQARGYRHLAFAGYRGHAYSDQRWQGYRDTLAAKGLTADLCAGFPTGARWRRRYPWSRSGADEAIADWLLSLSRPLAVFAANDARAALVLRICYHLGIRVPEEVAVLGVDDDQMVCESAFPQLSSIAIPARQIGIEAGRLLEQLLEGVRVPTHPILLPPIGIVTRRSTDVLAIDDPDLRTAVQFIRAHAHERIGVEAVLRAIPLSRSSLERRFKAVLRRTPLDEIHLVRIEKAKHLLLTTPMGLRGVALATGYANAQRLVEAFRRIVGRSPTAYRTYMRHASPHSTSG